MPKVEEPPKKAPEQSSSSNISKREKRKRDHQDRSDRKSSKNKIIIEGIQINIYLTIGPLSNPSIFYL